MPEQADGKPQHGANIKILEVEIEPPTEKSMVVTRKVTYAKVGIRGWFRETVSPMYVPDRSEDKATDSSAAMTAFQKHWDESATQPRTTAKWIATALGAALAALVGTAPLTGLSDDYIPPEVTLGDSGPRTRRRHSVPGAPGSRTGRHRIRRYNGRCSLGRSARQGGSREGRDVADRDRVPRRVGSTG